MKKYALKIPRADQTGSDHFSLDYEAELNEAQLQVVKTFYGPNSGGCWSSGRKTRTLTYRVARMVESGIAPKAFSY